MGFGKSIQKKSEERLGAILSKTVPDDLIQYGLIPEFVGRFPVVATLNDLGLEDLKRIMLEPKNAIVNQYKKLLEIDGIELEFSDEALTAIAEKAMKRGTGARALKSVLENVMLDIMYDMPSKKNVEKVMVTPETVEEGIAKITTRKSA